MQRIALVLACLACVGHGQQVQYELDEGAPHSLKALAALLLKSNSAAAFSPSAPAISFGTGGQTRFGRHVPKTSMSDNNLNRRAALLGLPAAALMPSAARAFVPYVRFAGIYSDPMHAGCPRRVKLQGSDVTITGVDEITGSLWTVKGKTSDTGMTIDFTPKGGPTGVPAQWVGDGFTFPDGNKWTKLTEKEVRTSARFASSYYDEKILGSQYFVKLTESGVVIQGSEGLGGLKWEGKGQILADKMVADLSPKGGKKEVTFTLCPEGLALSTGEIWKEQRFATVR